MEDLAYRLERQEIITTVKYKSGSTTERQGISFKLNDFIFKGSKVDRMYSLKGLEKTLGLNRRWKLTKQDALTPNHPSRNISPFRITYLRMTGTTPYEEKNKGVVKMFAKGLGEVTGKLISPEEEYDPLANEITNASRRKKKKRKGLNH